MGSKEVSLELPRLMDLVPELYGMKEHQEIKPAAKIEQGLDLIH